MSHMEGSGGKKVSRIIWMAPNKQYKKLGNNYWKVLCDVINDHILWQTW